MTKYIIDEHAHQLIKKVYHTSVGKGEVKKIAKSLQLPAWKVSRHAVKNGWISRLDKGSPWSKAEIHILTLAARYSPEIIQKKLKKAGYNRTASAIVHKRKRLRCLSNLNGQSAHRLAECFGVTHHFVLSAINKKKLIAFRRGTKRVAAQGGDEYFIQDFEVRKYIIKYISEIDIKKIDKYWLVDILVWGRDKDGGMGRM